MSYQIDVVKVSEETLKAEREKLENIEKEYAFIRYLLFEFTYFLPHLFFFRGSITIQNTICINQNVRSKYIINILTNRKSN